GVTAVNHYSWFGGVYDEPKNMFPNFAMDPETVGQVWAQYGFHPVALESFRKIRNAALVGEQTMRKFHFRIGQQVTLSSSVYPVDLTFQIVGVIPRPDSPLFWFNRQYLEEAMERCGGMRMVGWVWLRVARPEDAERVMRTVVDLFRNSEAEVAAETEKSFFASFFSSMQGILRVVLIVGFLVVGAVVLIAANTAAMGVRERILEIAVLKSLGFQRRPILLTLMAESALVALLGGLLGGLQGMLASTGEPDNLIVLRKGATSDGASVVPREAAQALRALAGVARAPDGTPLASPEMLNQPFLHTEAGTRENVLVRGVEPVAFTVHRAVRVVEGRMFRPKLGEVVIGRGALRRYAPGGLGSALAFGRRRWTVVGVFDSGGTAFDSEIWADLTDVLDDTRREGFVSGVRLRVAPGTDGRALARRIESDGRFTLEAKPEADYYREQAETANALYILVLTLGIAMAVGATFGALNTLYAA